MTHADYLRLKKAAEILSKDSPWSPQDLIDEAVKVAAAAAKGSSSVYCWMNGQSLVFYLIHTMRQFVEKGGPHGSCATPDAHRTLSGRSMRPPGQFRS